MEEFENIRTILLTLLTSYESISKLVTEELENILIIDVTLLVFNLVKSIVNEELLKSANQVAVFFGDISSAITTDVIIEL